MKTNKTKISDLPVRKTTVTFKEIDSALALFEKSFDDEKQFIKSCKHYSVSISRDRKRDIIRSIKSGEKVKYKEIIPNYLERCCWAVIFGKEPDPSQNMLVPEKLLFRSDFNDYITLCECTESYLLHGYISNELLI